MRERMVAMAVNDGFVKVSNGKLEQRNNEGGVWTLTIDDKGAFRLMADEGRGEREVVAGKGAEQLKMALWAY